MSTYIQLPPTYGLERLRTYFVSQHRPFKIHRTRYSIRMENDKDRFMIASNPAVLSKGFFLAAMHVRKEIENNLRHVRLDHVPPLKFFEIASELPATPVHGSELDLSKAYATSAAILGLISDDTYQRISKYNKGVRNKVIGMIATTSIHEAFDADGNMTIREKICNEDLRQAWFSICGQVDHQMSSLTQHEGFLFYWFDNVFYSHELSESERADLMRRCYFIAHEIENPSIVTKTQYSGATFLVGPKPRLFTIQKDMKDPGDNH